MIFKYRGMQLSICTQPGTVHRLDSDELTTILYCTCYTVLM